MRATYRGDGYLIEVSSDPVVFQTRGHHELARSWSATDAAGHCHDSLDSLHLVETGRYWCEECRDEHEESEYRCRLCGATVEPDFVFVGPDTHQVAGLAEGCLTLDDGRVYVLRGDETKILWRPTGGAEVAWLEAVSAREPDEWRLVLGAKS